MHAQKYSTIATPAAMDLLVKNGIRFCHTKGIQCGKFRLYFIADPEVATLILDLGQNVKSETDGWDFNHWSALK